MEKFSYLKPFLISFIGFALLSQNAFAATQVSPKPIKTFQDYREGEIEAGEFVCEPTDPLGQTMKCFYTTEFATTIVPENDESGAMQARRVSKKQGAFVEVVLDQLITSSRPDEFETVHIFDFYLKLHWRGKRPDSFDESLSGDEIIKGRVVRNPKTGLEIDVVEVPDLYSMQLFMPDFELAEVFGRIAMEEEAELKHDVEAWVKLIVSPALHAYFNKAPVVLPNP